MNICEFRLYNSMGVIIDRVNFMASPFASPLGLKIPRPTKRQLEIGVNLFRDGSDIAESKYNNAQVSLQPTLVFGNCTADEGARLIESMRDRLNRILEESRMYTMRRTYNYVRFAEDTKGFLLESEIMDGNFEIEDDWSWSPVTQGVVATSTLVMIRRPFRVNPVSETVRNYINNPSFELCDNTGCYLGWTFSGAAPNITIGKPDDSVDGDKSLKITEVGGVSSGGHYVYQVPTQYFDTTLQSDGIHRGMIYAEAWIATTGDPTKARWDLWINGVSTGKKVSWVPAEVPAYKDSRWYANRQVAHPEDASTPNQYANRKSFIRRGIFINLPLNTGYQSVQLAIAHANLGGSPIAADSSAYIDRVYMTLAGNFLNDAQQRDLYLRVASSGSVIVDPSSKPSDIDWMPKAWGSAAQINEVYDHGSGLASYLDLDSIPGDAPAKVELSVGLLAELDQTDWAMSDVLASMAARHSQYFIREGLVIPNSNLASLPLNTTDLIATSASSKTISSDTYNFTMAESFYIKTGVDRTKKAGNYHIFVRCSNGTDYTLLKARYVIQIGFSDQYIYGQEIVFPTTPNSLLNYVSIDLGVISIPDLQDDSVIRVFVQYRATSGSQTVNTDAIILLPADEWFSAGSLGASASYNKADLLRIGSLTGRDNLPITGFVNSASIGTPDYISSHSPYLVPGRLNRIYFQFNQLVSTYFRSAKKQTAEYWLTGLKVHYVKTTYQERYL